MVMFDEFSTISLLDEHGDIDAVRYPSFARLAHDSTWFANDTASVDETGRAVETILTGNMPERHRPATFASNPQSLFTLLEPWGYRMNASEEVTSVCPTRLCPHNHPKSRRFILHQLAHGRPARFERWVRSIRPSRQPTLFFKHALLPHVPLRYLPSGRHYQSRAHELIPGVVQVFRDRWLIDQAYQRHLLQVGFTDRLLGSLLRRLRDTGLYDRALIVVTADNGESFGGVGNRHQINSRNAGDIALTPLFIKRPFQRRGRIVRRHVRTVDVLPTIAHLLDRRVPWRTQGLPALGPRARRIPRSVLMVQRSGRRLVLTFRDLRRRARAALRLKLRLFGAGTRPPGVYGIGPDPLLRALAPVVPWPVAAGGPVRALIDRRRSLSSVRLSSGFIPSQITGRLVGKTGRRPLALAIAVNGLIAATAPSFRAPGSRHEVFSAMVPESAFHDGPNRVDVFSVERGREGLRLRRLGASGA